MRYPWLGLLIGAYAGLSLAGDTSPDTPLIQYKDIILTQEDYDAELATFPEQYQAEITASDKRVHQLLDKIFVYRVLAQEARELGLDQDPLLRKQVQMAEEEVLGKARLERLRQQASAVKSDFEALAKERYQANRDQYRLPERVRVAHILIKSEGNSADAEEKARQLAEKVRQLALTGDKPFAELALQYSRDPSVKQNKGELGFISQGATVKPFEKAAFSLQKPGEISPVVKSKFGFHIIRLEQRQPAQVQPFDQVKEKLIAEIKRKHLNDVAQIHLSQIRNADGIKMNGEAIKKLMTPNSPPPPVLEGAPAVKTTP